MRPSCRSRSGDVQSGSVQSGSHKALQVLVAVEGGAVLGAPRQLGQPEGGQLGPYLTEALCVLQLELQLQSCTPHQLVDPPVSTRMMTISRKYLAPFESYRARARKLHNTSNAICIIVYSSSSVFCHTAGPWQPNSPSLPVLGPSLQISIPFLLNQIINHTYTLSTRSFLAFHFPLHNFFH